MPKTHYTDVMKSVVKASKEIIKLKLARMEIRNAKVHMTNCNVTQGWLERTESEIEVRIKVIQIHISRKMDDITGTIPFFPTITHFTQEELDKGYAIYEYSMSTDGPESFDDDGDFVESFVRHAIILHNGKVIPFSHADSQIVIKQAKPV